MKRLGSKREANGEPKRAAGTRLWSPATLDVTVSAGRCWAPMAALTDKQERFALAVVMGDMTASDAYRSVYDASRMLDASVWRKAAELMVNVKVAARIAELRATARERTAWDVSRVLNHLADIATADPAELIRSERRCCRHCHGQYHLYQWRSEAEWVAACDEAGKLEQPPPDNTGGYGFRKTERPHPGCIVCDGEGYEHIHLADVRDVKGPARRLYAGVKKTKDGIEIKMRDQDAALVNIAKIIGAFAPERHELTGKDGAPIEQTALVALDPIAAAEVYRKLVQGGR